jgi:hypothetical protein
MSDIDYESLPNNTILEGFSRNCVADDDLLFIKEDNYKYVVIEHRYHGTSKLLDDGPIWDSGNISHQFNEVVSHGVKEHGE